MESINCKIVSWNEIEKWTRNVASQIRKEGFAPEICIGLTRGGWIPSRLICDHLRIKDLHSVKTEHWGITATKDGEAKLAAPLTVEIAEKRILLVDDITDTGQSMKLAFEHARSKGSADVRSATLLHIAHSKFKPDFYALEVPAAEWTWFIFPWNFNEDIQSLVHKTLADGAKGDGEIMELLKKHCKITVDDDVIRDTLAELAKRREVVRSQGKWHRNKVD